MIQARNKMDEEIIDPEQEIERIEKAIVKYQFLIKNSGAQEEKRTYKRKLDELKAYRGKLLYHFEHKSKPGHNSTHREKRRNFLDIILTGSQEEEYSTDIEINTLCIYLNFFSAEFLSIFSERKMKLDFKFSLDRDNFHNRYQELHRIREDFREEADRIRQGEYSKELEMELKRRNLQKKRNLLLESNKFFKLLEDFSLEILKDLNSSQLICLNGDDIINFDLIEGKRFLEGYTLKEAIYKLYRFVQEVIGFLNIPEID